MALTNQSINSVKDLVKGIEISNDKIINSTITFEYVMNNQDFMTFAEGTKFGSEKQQNLKDLVELIKDSFNKEVKKLANDTIEFLDFQQHLNNN